MRKWSLFLMIFIVLLLASCARNHPVEQLTVISHPDGPFFVGDQVSFEVLVPVEAGSNAGSIEVSLDGRELGRAGISSYGIGGRSQATLLWVWETHNLEPGRYMLSFNQLPDGISWTETYSLRPANQVPSPEPIAFWDSMSADCCILYYITGTDAERDIATLSHVADEQSKAVSLQMGINPDRPIDIIFMSRVVGHGGFTWNGIYVSYLDDNYIGNDMDILFHHEFVHFYDSALGGGYRPSILQEGLAVFLSGGHFKPEALGPRGAALIQSGWYIPLTKIADGFYTQQHDIGYLEAGALVQYLIETYGWDQFMAFYCNIPSPENQKDSVVLDKAFRTKFGITFSDLEKDYISYLKSQPVTDEVIHDLKLTVAFFDTVRRYQELLDPSAYFLTAWLPDVSLMRERNIVADYLRHPEGWQNRLIENLLVRSQSELFDENYENVDGLLLWTNWFLTLFQP
jgi:hypothetical protein